MKNVIELRNGKFITVAKLGARKQAKALDLIFDLIQDYKGSLDNLDMQAGIAFIRQVALSNFDKVAELLCLISTMELSDLESDDEGAVGLDEITEILMAAYRANNVEGILQRLGNAPGPLLQPAKGQGGIKAGPERRVFPPGS